MIHETEIASEAIARDSYRDVMVVNDYEHVKNEGITAYYSAVYRLEFISRGTRRRDCAITVHRGAAKKAASG